MTIVRNLEDEESREFWRSIDAGAKEVDTWPDWKRRLIAGERDEDVADSVSRDSETSESTDNVV